VEGTFFETEGKARHMLAAKAGLHLPVVQSNGDVGKSKVIL
jgi:hypothetical protein